MESKDTTGEQQTGKGRSRLAWISHGRSEKWNDRPVPLDTGWDFTRPVPSRLGSDPPPTTPSHRLKVLGLEAKEHTYGSPHSPSGFYSDYPGPHVPCQSPHAHSLLGLFPPGLVHFIQRSKRVTGVHTSKVKWLRGSHLQGVEGIEDWS